MKMISVESAEQAIVDRSPNFEIELCPLRESYGRVLRTEVRSERAHPPFHRVAMDGIGIRFADWQAGCKSFTVVGIQGAGQKAPLLETENGCYEVMTGAVLPEGADCVIPYERIEITDGVATLEEGLELSSRQNIHGFAEDHDAGELLLQEGALIKSPQLSVLATEGYQQVPVSRLPKITVLSTGDELLEVSEKPEAWQIRRSNSFSIVGTLKAMGYDARDLHMKDEPEEIRQILRQALADSDILILSGGVSMGKFDFIPTVLKELQVEEVFHKITQRPGKPMWFGALGDKTVFALPGNPVSTIISFHRYVLPQLEKSLLMKPRQTMMVRLTEEIRFKKSMTYFMPVALSFSAEGVIHAEPRKTNGSGDFASLCESHGFVELPADKEVFQAGEVYPFTSWNGTHEY